MQKISKLGHYFSYVYESKMSRRKWYGKNVLSIILLKKKIIYEARTENLFYNLALRKKVWQPSLFPRGP